MNSGASLLTTHASSLTVLAFDTCFSACSVAVGIGNGEGAPRLVQEHHAMDMGHAEALTPMIARVMRAAELSFNELDRVVVTHGPGTFTGVRTGVAAARAIALATKAEIIAVSSLWAIAAEIRATLADDAPFDAVLVAMDARKGQFYVQVIDRAGQELTEPELMDADAAAGLAHDRRMVATGNSAYAIMDAARRVGRTTLVAADAAGMRNCILPDAKHLIGAAGRCSIRGALLPLYLRPPDAKPQADKSLPWSSR